jgi:hypothetical protein
LPLLKRLPHHVGQEAHQNMRQHAIFALMPDGTDRQLAFVDAERRLRLAKRRSRAQMRPRESSSSYEPPVMGVMVRGGRGLS